MNDEQMQSALDEWFEDTDPQPPNARRTASRVMGQVTQTRQRGRWLPFRLAPRRSETPTVTNTADYQPSPIPATNGHSPTVIRRTQSMLSPVKAITAGAVVFAIGSAFLIAQPFGQQGSVPGAETEAIAPTWITGSVQPAPSCSSGDLEIVGDVQRHRDVECSPQVWTSSDPRLSGDVVRRWSWDAYQTDEGSVEVWMDAAYLRNDDGGWACSSSGLNKGGAYVAAPWTFTCIGDGGYAGLSASLVLTDAGGNAEDIVGLIFSGDFPPLPEAPAAE